MQEYTLSVLHIYSQKLESAPMVTKEMLEMKQHLVAERKKEVFSLSRQIQSLNYPPSPLPLPSSLPPPSISPSPPSHQEIEKRLERSRMSKKDRLRKEIMAARELNPSEVSHW